MLTVGEGSFYVVRIEAFADPSPPNIDIDHDESMAELAQQWEQLLDELREMSEQEMMDQVYRRVTLQLCGSCYRRWIENPTG